MNDSKSTLRRDFPFYDGAPVRLSLAKWLLLLAVTGAGFVALILAPTLLPTPTGRWVGIALFVALPLLGLALVAGRDWTALFHRPTWRDVWIGLATAPLCLLVSAIVGYILTRIGQTAGNPAADMMVAMPTSERLLFFAGMAPQLLGEELVTVIPFLAVLSLLHGPMKASRRVAIAVAWIASALLFGALHLSTYQWHVAQVLLVIGSARLVLTLPYLITRNIWASTIAHVTNDWVAFGTVLALAAFTQAGG